MSLAFSVYSPMHGSFTYQPTTEELLDTAFSLFELKKFKKALKIFNDILTIEPDNVDALHGKNITLQSYNKPAVALTYMLKKPCD